MTNGLSDQLREYGLQVEAEQHAVSIAETKLASGQGSGWVEDAQVARLDVEATRSASRRSARLAVLVAAALLAIAGVAVLAGTGDEGDDLRIEAAETTTSTSSASSTTLPLVEVPGLPSAEAIDLVEEVLGSFGPPGPSGARDFSSAVEALGDDAVWVEPDGVEYRADEIQAWFEEFETIVRIDVVGPVESTGDAYVFEIEDVFADGTTLRAWLVVEVGEDGVRRLNVKTTKPEVREN